MHKVYPPQHFYDDNETAFVFGGNGVYATSELFKCLSAVESLSTTAGWSGHIYLILDRTTCLDKNFIKSLPNKNIHVVVLDKARRRLRESEAWNETLDFEDLEMSPADLPPSHRHLLNAKRFQRAMGVKMHVLDYLPPHIKYAAWYDCDVVFPKPGCARDMVRVKPPFTKDKPIFLRKNDFVGSFVAHRDFSGPALKAWHAKLMEGNSGSALDGGEEMRDNVAFSELFGYKAEDPGSKFGISDPGWHDQMPYSLAPNGSVYWDTSVCAYHFSNGRCRHLGSDVIDKAIDSFKLQSTEGFKWCPSLIRRKMKTYGIEWPFCWTPPFIWNA
jgi:hypothetical protein